MSEKIEDLKKIDDIRNRINQILGYIDSIIIELKKPVNYAEQPKLLKIIGELDGNIGELHIESCKILLILTEYTDRLSKSSKRLEILTLALIFLTTVLLLEDIGILPIVKETILKLIYKN